VAGHQVISRLLPALAQLQLLLLLLLGLTGQEHLVVAQLTQLLSSRPLAGAAGASLVPLPCWASGQELRTATTNAASVALLSRTTGGAAGIQVPRASHRECTALSRAACATHL
jgi:hypothetical protein